MVTRRTCGKCVSVTTVSVAAGLAMKGYKVLLVDTDSQGNVGVSLGVKAEKTLYHCLVMGLKPQDVAVKVRENLDLVPSNETLAAAELYLAGRQNRDRILRERLASANAHYDVVILDCSPSLSLLNQNALVFADGILVPVACDFLSLVGVRQVIKTVKNVNSLLHHPVSIYGVLPTFYDARARICRDAWGTLKEHFGDRCFQPVRQTIKINPMSPAATAASMTPWGSGRPPMMCCARASRRLLSAVRKGQRMRVVAAEMACSSTARPRGSRNGR